MRFLRRHPDTAQLGLSLLDAPDASTAEHLSSCSACRRRRARLASRLSASRAGAHAAADAAFPPAALERQRAAILQRIARAGSGRVLAFPRSSADAVPPAPRLHDGRWIAVAAAAGLLLGVAVGQLPLRRPAATVAQAPVTQAADPAPRRDDTLLRDVEEVLTSEVRPEFGALDGLTPIAYETR